MNADIYRKLLSQKLPPELAREITSFLPIPLNNTTIREAVKLWFDDRKKCLEIYGHISRWDTSRVSDMSDLFIGRTNFNEDISMWKIKRVKDFRQFLKGCIKFNQNLQAWDSAKPKFTKDAFKGCKIDTFDCPIWYGIKIISNETIDCTTIPYSFIRRVMKVYPKATKIEYIRILGYDLDNYEQYANNDFEPVKKVNSFNFLNLFDNRTKFNQDLSSWKDVDFSKMFSY